MNHVKEPGVTVVRLELSVPIELLSRNGKVEEMAQDSESEIGDARSLLTMISNGDISARSHIEKAAQELKEEIDLLVIQRDQILNRITELMDAVLELERIAALLGNPIKVDSVPAIPQQIQYTSQRRPTKADTQVSVLEDPSDSEETVISKSGEQKLKPFILYSFGAKFLTAAFGSSPNLPSSVEEVLSWMYPDGWTSVRPFGSKKYSLEEDLKRGIDESTIYKVVRTSVRLLWTIKTTHHPPVGYSMPGDQVRYILGLMEQFSDEDLERTLRELNLLD